jgi:cysteine desulfurase
MEFLSLRPASSVVIPGMAYFDFNATTPFTGVAREAWSKACDDAWHNPSSPYRDGTRVRLRMDAARSRVAEFVGCKPEQIVFTSGATEGANAVVTHWARMLPPGSHIGVSPTEHPAVLASAQQRFKNRIIWIGISADGRSELQHLETLVKTRSVHAVAIMAANNETGVLQPWQKIAALCRAVGVPYLCDATQWLGKLPAAGLGSCDWVVGSAHKFGGPKGVGFLKVAEQAESFRGLLGGGQEYGHRGGTENYPGIAAMAAALAESEQAKVLLEGQRASWRERFEREVTAALPGTMVVGAKEERLWNTVSLLMPFAANHRWVAKLDKRGFQVSTGSACATGKGGPSHVLTALGVTLEDAKRVVRISSGWSTAEADWQALIQALVETSKELGEQNPSIVRP